jgi:hypothetical protein
LNLTCDCLQSSCPVTVDSGRHQDAGRARRGHWHVSGRFLPAACSETRNLKHRRRRSEPKIRSEMGPGPFRVARLPSSTTHRHGTQPARPGAHIVRWHWRRRAPGIPAARRLAGVQVGPRGHSRPVPVPVRRDITRSAGPHSNGGTRLSLRLTGRAALDLAARMAEPLAI